MLHQLGTSSKSEETKRDNLRAIFELDHVLRQRRICIRARREWTATKKTANWALGDERPFILFPSRWMQRIRGESLCRSPRHFDYFHASAVPWEQRPCGVFTIFLPCFHFLWRRWSAATAAAAAATDEPNAINFGHNGWSEGAMLNLTAESDEAHRKGSESMVVRLGCRVADRAIINRWNHHMVSLHPRIFCILG